jgi:hypothetical protein
MFRGRIDLPLTSDPATRLLPWIISVMVYLAMLMLSGALVLAGATASWEEGLSGRYTVQIPPIEGETTDEINQRIDRAIRVLKRTPGVSAAAPVPLTEIAASLEPWLGAGTSVLDLPLPHLIDVTLEAEATVNLKQLRQQMSIAVPGASLDDSGGGDHPNRDMRGYCRGVRDSQRNCRAPRRDTGVAFDWRNGPIYCATISAPRFSTRAQGCVGGGPTGGGDIINFCMGRCRIRPFADA